MEASLLAQLLLKAAIAGDVAELKRLCATSPKAATLLLKHRFGSSGESYLHHAAVNGRIEVAQYLIHLGADVNIQNGYGWTPAMLAEGSFMRFLLSSERRVNLDAHTYYGSTALMAAVNRGSIEDVCMLINAGVDVNARHCSSTALGLTSLMVAAFRSSRQIVSILLSAGAEVNAQLKLNGMTALMFASIRHDEKNSVDIVQLLLENGADTQVKNTSGETCITMAKHLRKYDLLAAFNIELSHSQAKRLEMRSPAKTKLKEKAGPIFEAIQSNNHPLLLSLLNSRPGLVSTLNHDGFSPLIFASCFGDNTSVKILLSYGALVNERHPHSTWPALMYATYYKRLNVIKILLEHGADTDLLANIDAEDRGHAAKISVHDIANMTSDANIVRLIESYPGRRHSPGLSSSTRDSTVNFQNIWLKISLKASIIYAKLSFSPGIKKKAASIFMFWKKKDFQQMVIHGSNSREGPKRRYLNFSDGIVNNVSPWSPSPDKQLQWPEQFENEKKVPFPDPLLNPQMPTRDGFFETAKASTESIRYLILLAEQTQHPSLLPIFVSPTVRMKCLSVEKKSGRKMKPIISEDRSLNVSLPDTDWGHTRPKGPQLIDQFPSFADYLPKLIQQSFENQSPHVRTIPFSIETFLQYIGTATDSMMYLKKYLKMFVDKRVTFERIMGFTKSESFEEFGIKNEEERRRMFFGIVQIRKMYMEIYVKEIKATVC